MTRFLYAAAIATFLSAPALAAEVKFPLTGDNTKIKYTGSKPGGKHDGDFKKLSGFATVTPSDPTTLKIELEIEMDSLSSDNPALTGHLKNPDFFNVKVNPKAIFKSTKIVKAEKGYTITGDLTMCGKTKEVSFPGGDRRFRDRLHTHEQLHHRPKPVGCGRDHPQREGRPRSGPRDRSRCQEVN